VNAVRYLVVSILVLFSSLVQAGGGTPAPQVNLADSKVVLTNSTLQPLNLTLRVQLDSALTSGTHYKLINATVAPLATADVASFSRTNGLQEGKSYKYFIDVQGASNTVTLSQTVIGGANGNSTLKFGANGNGFNVAPQTNRAIQRHNTTFGNSAVVAFNAETISSADQVNYVIHENTQKPNISAANTLNVLSYNVWLTTIFGSKDVNTRVAEQPAVLSGYDVVVGTEYFDDAPSAQLQNAIRGEYPYQTGSAFKAGKIMPAGTFIYSRWPIDSEKHFFFDDCNGIQCAASRAVIYTKIRKQGNPYHVFATHTQSSDDQPNRDARLKQINQMAGFVQSLNLSANEPVIYAGDFNVNKIGLPEDRDTMESVLSAVEPTNIGHNLTFDSNTNHWAEAPYLEYLDYTLYSNVNLIPVSATQEAFAPRSISDAMWQKWDLSDHYAVRGVFAYNTSANPARAAFPFAGDVVHLKTSNGHYVRAMSGGNSFVSAGSDSIGTWESFTVIDRGNGKVALQARDGHYVGLDSYLVGTLNASNDNINSWEEFEVTNLGGNKVALKAANGKYLKADFAGGYGLAASAGSVGSWETFELIRP
jgi:endonuclease/exonuclease/phosphatase family metal-dependent hydrolase